MADKPDSHDICFIPAGDTAGFLARSLGSAAARSWTPTAPRSAGTKAPTSYTVGQRRGLHLERPAADGRPRFVLAIEPAANRVVVGPREALAVDRIRG